LESWGLLTLQLKKMLRTIVPLPEINVVKTICYILEGILKSGEDMAQLQKQLGAEEGAKLMESVFVFACVWGVGGAITGDKTMDYRSAFDKWWKEEWKNVRFPEQGTVFDYLIDKNTGRIGLWSEKVPSYSHIADGLFGNIVVTTVETQRLSHLLDLLMPNRRAVMFVGPSGTGKTTVIRDKLKSMDAETMAFLNINLNCFTDSLSLQLAMEGVLEKKSGRVFGPLGSRKLVYFIDDLNLPLVDKYGTQQPIALLRQQMDYGTWYDRAKLTLKEIKNVQYLYEGYSHILIPQIVPQPNRREFLRRPSVAAPVLHFRCSVPLL
jgi:dynein heavy chain, axonemal